jgi:hypothetical protein
MKKFGLALVIVGALYALGDNDAVSIGSSGCDAYASSFACDYVKNKATYTVAYWKDVNKNDPKDERIVGTAIGLSRCRDTAIYAHRAEMDYRKRHWNGWSDSDDNWSERSYICILTKDGRNLEKHRL